MIEDKHLRRQFTVKDQVKFRKGETWANTMMAASSLEKESEKVRTYKENVTT